MIVIFVSPMLMRAVEKPFSDPNHIYELKLDGHRLILSKQNGKIQCFTRHGNEVTVKYPELHSLDLPENIVLDGELIVYNPETKSPDFELLMQRFHSSDPYKMNLIKRCPVTFVAFDILFLEGDLRQLPLMKRKELLEETISDTSHLNLIRYIEGQGEAFFQAIVKSDLEGMVAKQKNSIYIIGRTDRWLKVLNYKFSEDVFVSGYRKEALGFLAVDPKGKPLGVIEHGGIQIRQEVYKVAATREKTEDRGFVYVYPPIRVKVKYLTMTTKGYLRLPVLLEVLG